MSITPKCIVSPDWSLRCSKGASKRQSPFWCSSSTAWAVATQRTLCWWWTFCLRGMILTCSTWFKTYRSSPGGSMYLKRIWVTMIMAHVFLEFNPQICGMGLCACWDLQRELLLGDNGWEPSVGWSPFSACTMMQRCTCRRRRQWLDVLWTSGGTHALMPDPVPGQTLLSWKTHRRWSCWPINNEQKSVQTLSLQFTIRCFFNSFQTQIGYYDHPNCGLKPTMGLHVNISGFRSWWSKSTTATHADQLKALNDKLDLRSSGCKCCQELWLSISVPFHHERTFFSHPENQCFAWLGRNHHHGMSGRGFQRTPFSIADFESVNTLLVKIGKNLCNSGSIIPQVLYVCGESSNNKNNSCCPSLPLRIDAAAVVARETKVGSGGNYFGKPVASQQNREQYWAVPCENCLASMWGHMRRFRQAWTSWWRKDFKPSGFRYLFYFKQVLECFRYLFYFK